MARPLSTDAIYRCLKCFRSLFMRTAWRIFRLLFCIIFIFIHLLFPLLLKFSYLSFILLHTSQHQIEHPRIALKSIIHHIQSYLIYQRFIESMIFVFIVALDVRSCNIESKSLLWLNFFTTWVWLFVMICTDHVWSESN